MYHVTVLRILIHFLLLISVFSHRIDYRKFRGKFPLIYIPTDPFEKMVHELDTTSSKLNESKTLLENVINGNIKLNKRIDYSETIMEWY